MSEDVRWVVRQAEGSAIEVWRMRVRMRGSFFRDSDFRIRWTPRLKCWRVLRHKWLYTHPSGKDIIKYENVKEFPCDPLDMAAVRQEAMDFAETTWRLEDAVGDA